MKSGATVCQHHTIQALSAMKLKIKQLSGSTTELDIEGGDTVATAKTKVAALVSAPSTEGMKLVYKGKVLEDKQTITESGCKDNDALIVVVPKAVSGGAAWSQMAPRLCALLRWLYRPT